ncbi:catalase HPII [Salinisphaera sp.]|uniref:catalase HPII n=1 Tax=Salinisphaera sp. TaxID=1914330 RepID=UPI002D793B7F|nr:catalase HPII [Salinisphaera sp.]HET7313994.1 catalase HPII [Salinisphaera sp.]
MSSRNPYTESNRSESTANPDLNARSKDADLEQDRHRNQGEDLRTNQGVRIADNHNQLKAGERGPTLMEDFIFREKMNHFDNERIPERVVHARGAAAHGHFMPYENAAKYSKAAVFSDQATPVFVRFSTVQGSRGSNDTVRDVRGFATKFYTSEGIWDLVGNNMPVFFIQDAIKFPDLVHAVKPEPHNEIPQGQSAHDTLWDFVSLMPESAHMILWTMSDRAFPRHYRFMEGFGVHTFRLVDGHGKSRFVKFHWKPVAGTCSLVWDEAQKLWGRDPDFNRREMWSDIENGDPLEWELGIQVVEEEDEMSFDFDILDATKIIPEEEVPVEPIGKLVLDRNPSNYFAETEQVAYNPAHIVPGIDFTNDPLLQGRLFSYLDTQMIRLQGPNFHEFPINRPVCPFANNQRDGMHRHTVNTGQAAYEPNSIDDGWPAETAPGPKAGGFESVNEKIDAAKIRARSGSFGDHYSQARLFWNSQSDVEKEHIVAAYTFELSKVARPYIRERVIQQILPNISMDLARGVGEKHGISVPDAPPAEEGEYGHGRTEKSQALSLMARLPGNIKHRKVAILAANGVDAGEVAEISNRLTQGGATPLIIAPDMAPVEAANGEMIESDAMLNGLPSVTVDAVIVPGGAASVERLAHLGPAVYYLQEAFKHLKPIAIVTQAEELMTKACFFRMAEGVFCGENIADVFDEFADALAHHRVWSRNCVANDMPA